MHVLKRPITKNPFSGHVSRPWHRPLRFRRMIVLLSAVILPVMGYGGRFVLVAYANPDV